MDEVFNEAELLETVQGDRELLAELGTLFLTDAPAQVAAIRDAIGRKDASALRFAAHALKGSAATLTARRIAGFAFELEKMGVAGNLAGADERVQQMEAALGELRDRLATRSA